MRLKEIQWPLLTKKILLTNNGEALFSLGIKMFIYSSEDYIYINISLLNSINLFKSFMILLWWFYVHFET